jgi:hypothetical protein
MHTFAVGNGSETYLKDLMESEEINSKLQLRSILGFSFFLLGCKDLLAWTAIVSPEYAWLIKLTGAEWVHPVAGLFFMVLGAALSWNSLIQCFSVRDTERLKARRLAMCGAFVCGACLLCMMETLLPSRAIFSSQGPALPKEARQAGLLGFLAAAGALVGFLLMRRRDAGFWTMAIPLERNNEIWRLCVNVEIAFRALPENAEIRRLVEQRKDFVQAEVGVKFDKLCEQLIKNFADLSTFDSTARLQMDAGHFFRRYADFHRRLAETRGHLFEEVMQVANDAVSNVLENKLPGQRVRMGEDRHVKVSIAHPVLDDAKSLQKRRSEWDQTLRTIVSDGAVTGNQIVGDWIDRASRGQVTPEQTPVFVQLMRASCRKDEPGMLGNGAPRETKALKFSKPATELLKHLGADSDIEDPTVANRLKGFFGTNKVLLADCSTPEISAELMIELLRAQNGGRVSLESIATAMSKAQAGQPV